jgi:hypothetical protein
MESAAVGRAIRGSYDRAAIIIQRELFRREL